MGPQGICRVISGVIFQERLQLYEPCPLLRKTKSYEPNTPKPPHSSVSPELPRGHGARSPTSRVYMYIFIFVCMYVCMYIYIHMYMHTCIYIYIYILYIYMHTDINISVSVRACVCDGRSFLSLDV